MLSSFGFLIYTGIINYVLYSMRGYKHVLQMTLPRPYQHPPPVMLSPWFF